MRLKQIPQSKKPKINPRQMAFTKSEVTAKRSYPATEVRGGSREDQPHVQGAVAAQAQEGLEALFHVEGQEGRR